MKFTGLKYLLTIIVAHVAIICVAQNNGISNLESAIQFMQNGDFKSTLSHIETYLNTNNSTDDDTYYVACCIGGASAHLIGDYQRSKDLLDKIVNVLDLPEEIKIQCLRYQLINLMELSLEDRCIPIINELCKLYKTTRSLNILNSIIYYYSNTQEYHKVLDLEKHIVSIPVPESPNDMSEIITISQLHGIYMNLAIAYNDKQDWNNSLKYWLKSLETIINDNPDTKSLIYTKIAENYSNMGDRKNALKYQELAMSVSTTPSSSSFIVNDEVRNIIDGVNKNIGKNESQEDDQRFDAIKLLNQGILLARNEQFTDAADTLKQALLIFEGTGEINNYYYTLKWLCHVYRGLGCAEAYYDAREKIKRAVKEDRITNPIIKLYILSQYGEILREEGEIEDAILVAEKSEKIAIDLLGSSNPETFPYVYTLCSLYLDKGDLIKSKDLIDKIKTLKLESQVDKTDYYTAILLESYWLQAAGKIGEMIQMLENIANVIENDYDFIEIKSQMYGALGGAYSSLGDFKKSLLYADKVVDIDKNLYGEKSPHYATALLNLSEMYAVNGFEDKAIDLTINSLGIFEKLYGKSNNKYIKCLQKLASRYLNKDPQRAKELYNECSALWEVLYGQNSREYAENLIWSNLDLTPYPSLTSIANVKKGIEIIRSLGLSNYEFYPSLLHFYCMMLYMAKDYHNLYNASSELLELVRNRIYRNFLIMPENQRESFWQSIKTELEGIEQFAADYSQYAVENNDYSLITEYSGMGYNARLLKKGLLLTSSRNIENIISKIDNQDIRKLLSEIKIQRNKLSTLQPGDNEYEQLERTCNNLERDLLSLISFYDDFMEFASAKWRDIQDVLMLGEVAIEFFSFPCQNDKQYGMTFVGSEGEPIIMNLFVESELSKYLNDDTTVYDYKSPQLYKTIWSALELFSDIKNAHTIYFSADGKLNTIAIENLCDSTGVLASEKRNIVRLSSTRELLQKNHRVTGTNAVGKKFQAVLYGGLDYNSSLPTLYSRPSNLLYASTAILPTAQRAFKNRAQFLKGTLKEVEVLSQQLRTGNNYNIILYTGSEGTERCVNNVPSLHPNLIHIATHGFYYDETNDNILNVENNSISVESRAMRESGLLLSGANHKLMGDELAEEHNDGILTAEEISTISLGEVDMVVLSACETGLGAVSGEGVFGLQRGFKLSGVNCIVMSLWKVDDDATKELMINFYNNLIRGSSKIEALHEAQKKIRDTPGYEDPEYWAGFIILDALN